MSDRAANTPSSDTESLLSSLVAEGLNPSAANKIELAIEAMIQAQVKQRIQAEIDRKIQSELDKFIQQEKARQDAQFDQRVAHEVVQKGTSING